MSLPAFYPTKFGDLESSDDHGMTLLSESSSNQSWLVDANICDYQSYDPLLSSMFSDNESNLSDKNHQPDFINIGEDESKKNKASIEVLIVADELESSSDDYDDDDEKEDSDEEVDDNLTTVVIYTEPEISFENPEDFEEAETNHQPEKVQEKQQPQLSEEKVFYMEDNYSEQEKLASLYTSPVKCVICDQEFDDHESFLSHVHIYHPIISNKTTRKAMCPFCSYSSKNKTSVTQHIRTHTKEKPFKCGLCGKSFSQKAGVQQHMRCHSSQKPHPCPDCGRCFKAHSSLMTHINMRHKKLKPYKCKKCDSTFGHRSNLRIHQRVHTKERPFVCDVCFKTFSQQGHLKTHMRTHTGEKPFKCELCAARFTHDGNLQQHMITQHTKKYPYRCERCDKGFIAPGDFNRHMLKHKANFGFVIC